jgi:DNA-binding transcriptional MocR family regulator
MKSDKSKGWTARKLSWLEGCARDRTMPRLSLAIAILLATRYLNAKTGKAWPAIATLADELSVTRANTHHAMERLVAAGWLGKKTGFRQSNTYWLATPESIAGDNRKPRSVIARDNRKRIVDDNRKRIARDNRTREVNPRGEPARARARPPIFHLGSRRVDTRLDWMCPSTR